MVYAQISPTVLTPAPATLFRPIVGTAVAALSSRCTRLVQISKQGLSFRLGEMQILAVTRPQVYWRDWRAMRRMLARVHPCMHTPAWECNVKRIGVIRSTAVLNCRCCGGLIVEPQKPLRNKDLLEGEIGERKTRSSTCGAGSRDLYAPDDRGRAGCH